MILEFSVKNFLSFKDKTTFSMIGKSGKGLPSNFVEYGEMKILKSAAIYGANASGKSNIFKALDSFTFMLRHSNQIDAQGKLPVTPFLFDDTSLKEPSEFEISFIAERIKYLYSVKLDEDRIYEESLHYYPNGRITKIFKRTECDKYSFGQKDEKFFNSIVPKNTPNKFFLATATNWNSSKTAPAYNFLTKDIFVWFDPGRFMHWSADSYAVSGKEFKKFALEILNKADPTIENFEVKKIEGSKMNFNFTGGEINDNAKNYGEAFLIEFKHKCGEKKILLQNESVGTQMIFWLIPLFSNTLFADKVLVIDELDRSLHPFLVQYIVTLFNDENYNKNGSQLIFNTHDTNLLDLNDLRRDQIWFIEKDNETGASELYSLKDFSVRKNENVEKGYMLGRYGAIPFIQNDINLWEKE